jgi:flagellar L-ring protein precursor FlgH
MRSFALACIVTALALPGAADSLFTKAAEKEGTLISDKRAVFKEGDIITVLIRENLDATTQADTNTKKDSSVEADAPPVANPFFISEAEGGLNIFSAEELPNWDIGIKNEHKSTGETRRANRLTTTISCTVKKVHENGNLDIEGSKQVTVNREDSTLHVRGTVRARDVGPGNTVLSTQVADAVIDLKGKGPLWNNQRRGILTRILDWFSPF